MKTGLFHFLPSHYKSYKTFKENEKEVKFLKNCLASSDLFYRVDISIKRYKIELLSKPNRLFSIFSNKRKMLQIDVPKTSKLLSKLKKKLFAILLYLRLPDKPGKSTQCNSIYDTILGQCIRNRANAGPIFQVCRVCVFYAKTIM